MEGWWQRGPLTQRKVRTEQILFLTPPIVREAMFRQQSAGPSRDLATQSFAAHQYTADPTILDVLSATRK